MPNDNTDKSGEDAPFATSQVDGAQPTADEEQQQQQQQESQEAQRKTVSPAAGQRAPTKESRQHGTRETLASWFAIPPPLKRIFDKFPLVTYAQNAPPVQGLRSREENALHIFTTREDAIHGRPSFNPSCLKWQTYLKIAGVPFRTVASNNHASPSGSLPFILVAPARKTAGEESSQPLPTPEVLYGSKLRRWIQQRGDKGTIDVGQDVRYEAYTSLLDNPIRKAWLYQLYLNPANDPVLKRLYIGPCSSNPIVQMTIASQLRSAATTEIIKASPQSSATIRIDEAEIMRDAGEALEALSVLLGEGEWFFAASDESRPDGKGPGKPGFFDASVFAYTQLIMDSAGTEGGSLMGWEENLLKGLLLRHENLARHRERVLEMYY